MRGLLVPEVFSPLFSFFPFVIQLLLLLLLANTKHRRSRAVNSPPVMRVDRPFLFLVFDGVTGMVLCGVVVSSIAEA